MDISSVKYPDLTNILNLKPAPQILLGRELIIQEKRDGSNIGSYLCDGKLELRSRNMDKASSDFYSAFNKCSCCDGVRELLMDAANWNKEYVIFGELLLKGKSPTRTEIHDKEEYIVFDIWDDVSKRWLSYVEVHQQCHHFGIPIVELYATANVTSIKSLIEFKDTLLEKAKDSGREGIVIKAYGNETVFCKEKNDTPKFERYPRKQDDGRVALPELPDSEVMGAIEKVLTDVGFEQFREKKIAMPLIAKYVGIECEKHVCSMPPMPLYFYYNKRLEDLVS